MSDGAVPAWDGDTCTNFCHGQTVSGGANKTPQWTGDSGEASCGTCHSLPPTGDHPAIADCSLCHSHVLESDNGFIDPDKHINGVVDF
jgi:predicted CxxxxCH...CXXCH cytochrome family protein